MTIDQAYEAYFKHPNEDTVTTLFTAMRSYALAIVRDYRRRNADDIAAEAVAKAWVSLPTYRHGPGSSFKGWFRAVCKNVLFDFTRKPVERYGASALDFDAVELAGQNHDGTLRSVDEIVGLTDEQKLTLKVFTITESFDKTARQLGISRKALDKRLAKIKGKRCA